MLFFLGSKDSLFNPKATASEPAMYIDEYVPIIIPIIKAIEKSFKVLPPHKHQARTTNNVNPDVISVLDRV